MNAKLCVAFGSLENPSAWASEIPDNWTPVIGMRTQFNMHVEQENGDTDDYEIVGQVVYTESDEEDGSTLAFIYGGEKEPEIVIQLLLEANGWVRLDDSEAHEIIQIVQIAPPSATMHDVLILVGDMETKDENGKLVFDVWTRLFEPEDPLLPMFGQRLFIDVVNSVDDEEAERILDDQGNVEIADLDAPASLDKGIPGLVIYCAIVSPGVAQMAFWVKSLGDIDGYTMMASGWEKIDQEDIDDNGDFRLEERLDLALRTRLDLKADKEGFPYLDDFSIDNAEEIPESSYDILPPMIVEYCKFAKELKPVENIDGLIAGWEDKGENNDER